MDSDKRERTRALIAARFNHCPDVIISKDVHPRPPVKYNEYGWRCKWCGKVFVGRKKVFCCELCREASVSASRSKPESKRICVTCGEEFFAKGEQRQRTCCHECSMGMRNARVRHRNGIPCVYIVQDGEFIKIGIARKLNVRLSGLRVGNPRPIRLIATIDGAGVDVECEIHKALNGSRVRGEWFRGDAVLGYMSGRGDVFVCESGDKYKITWSASRVAIDDARAAHGPAVAWALAQMVRRGVAVSST